MYSKYDIVNMTQTVSVRLSKESLREIDRLAERLKTDRSEALRRFIERGLREAKIDDALDRLRQGKVSIGRAAEDAGITLYEMVELVRQHRIPSGYGPEDLERDLRELGYRG
jgi:predicted HTH domain antitoxin